MTPVPAPDRDGSSPAYRLVATDLDGTLLHSDGTVTARTGATLRAVEDLGVVVVFVTGRPIRWMEMLWEHVGEHGLAVCSNGGIVYDVPRRRVRTVRPIPREVALSAADRLREALPGTTFGVERVEGFGREPEFDDGLRTPPGARVADLATLLGPDVVKLLARHRDLDADAFRAETERLVGDLVTVTGSSPDALLEISAAGVTKATTLALLCEELGIGPGEVVAFGDMPNDLAMLGWAGASYAMADAHPAVIDLAEHRAPGHDDDGVAAVLERLFGLPAPC